MGLKETVRTVDLRDTPPGYRVLTRLRWLVMPSVDSAIWVVALIVANLMRQAPRYDKVFTHDLVLVAGVAVGCQVMIGAATQLYRARWRVGSFEEMVALTTVVSVSSLIVTLVDLTESDHFVPASVPIAGGALTLIVAAGVRSTWRMAWEHRLGPGGDVSQRAIVFGAGQGGVQVVTSLLAGTASPYIPVALLDDDPAKARLRVRHLRVLGNRHSLARVAEQTRAEALIVAIPSASSALIRELSDMAADSGLEVLVLPSVEQIFASEVTASDIRPVALSDLLGRRVISTDIDSVAGYITGRRVLVTGAGGSIGSELCRQIHRYAPENLIMLDRDESGLHQVQLSIEGRALLDTRSLVVCDIRDPELLEAVFEEHRPEVVFHAAALKHLPLLEMWPAEAVRTNVFGTRNLLDLSAAYGVERFINISTDKAANPTSVLGYTKRIAERLTAGMNNSASGTYLSVRFGNVLGSRGSVITAFRAQIAAGGPVTVTHPDVTRFFMTVEEAVELVIQAGALGRRGEALVLDMGEPVRIAEVAQRLVDESGKDIGIVYTGLRPAEKMHEELMGETEIARRDLHPLISHIEVPSILPHPLELLLIEGDVNRLKALLREMAARHDSDQASVTFQVGDDDGAANVAFDSMGR